MRPPAAGAVEAHFDYCLAMNRDMVYSFLRDPLVIAIFGVQLPDELPKFLAAYPDQAQVDPLSAGS